MIDLRDLPQEAFTTTVFAAGNMTSSSADLLDWGDALYSGELLGPEATAAMLDMRSSFTFDAGTRQLVATDEPTPLHYGLGAMGFCLDPTGCSPDEVEVVGHSGSNQGYRTLVAHHPASGTTLVFFANWGDIPSRRWSLHSPTCSNSSGSHDATEPECGRRGKRDRGTRLLTGPPGRGGVVASVAWQCVGCDRVRVRRGRGPRRSVERAGRSSWRGARVEVRRLGDEPPRGTFSAAQRLVIDQPLFHADLFDRVDHPRATS